MADALTDAIKIAKSPRPQADNPLARRSNARMNIENRNEREATLRAVHDAYDANFGKYDDPQPVMRKAPTQYLEQPGRISVNILKLFIDAISVSYDEPPQRVYYRNGERVEGDDPVVKALNKQHAAADFDRFMGQIDRWLRLFGNTVARPRWDEEAQQLVYLAYPSYCVRVVENALNPRAPRAVALLGYYNGVDDSGLPKIEETAEVWTPDTYVELKNGEEVMRADLASPEYRYEFMPLVHCFDSPPFGGQGRYYVPAMGWPLAQQNQRLNEDYISQYAYATLMQAIGIMVVKGQIEGELIISPGRAIHFPNAEDGSMLSSVAQNASLNDFRECINFIIDLLRETYGIPKSMLNAEVSSSGQAIIQASAPLAEIRKHRQGLFSKIETDLLRATLQELRGRADGFDYNLNPMEWEVSLVYPDPAANMSTNDRVLLDQHLVGMGVLTPAEILMREKPGQFDTVEQAEEWIEAHQPEKEEEDAGEVEAEGNPYKVVKRGDEFCVVKADGSKTMKCYQSREEAMDYFKALEANVKET